MLAAVGCDGIQSTRLVDYLDELEFDVPLDTATYVPLGRFDIPIAASHTPANGSKYVAQVAEQGLVWMRLQFELTAETTPAEEKAVLAAAEERRGALNDLVLTIVRTSSVDELADPRLATVNARISEALRPIFGEGRVRQLVFNDPQTVEARQKKEQAAGSHGGEHGDIGHGGGHGDGEHGGEAHGGQGSHGTGHGDGHAEDNHGHAEHGQAGESHEQEHGGDDQGHH
jgi:hypothetical protein